MLGPLTISAYASLRIPNPLLIPLPSHPPSLSRLSLFFAPFLTLFYVETAMAGFISVGFRQTSPRLL